MGITAIIVTHNSADAIEGALESLRGHPAIIHCIVIDNASSDNTLDIVRARFPEVWLVHNLENAGFGNACNQALQQVTTDFSLLVNPDTRIDHAGIDALMDALTTYPQAAIVAPVFEDTEGDCSTASIRLPVMAEAGVPLVVPLTESIVLARFVSGALALWRMEHMRRVGFFDPSLFLFYEDDDLSLRVNRAGYDMLLVSGLHATHRVGTSTRTTSRIRNLKLRSLYWGKFYMQKKYRSNLLAWPHALASALLSFVAWLCMWCACKLVAAEKKLQPAKQRHASQLDAAREQHEEKWQATSTQHAPAQAKQLHEEEWQAIAEQFEMQWKKIMKRYTRENIMIETKRELFGRMLAALQFLWCSKRFRKHFI
ncbi:MAG: glycosyltransferase family 2 protein [Alphaproteobacteria bacterium]